MSADLFEKKTRQIRRGKDPKDANDNDCQADEQRIPDQPLNGDGMTGQRAHHFGQLESNEDEDEAVLQEFHHFPHRPAPQTGPEAEQFGHAHDEIQAGGHDRENARKAESLGR